MANFVSRLRERWGHQTTRKMERNYVSDFTLFIDHFMEEHPEELEVQRTGRRLYWEKQVDLLEQEKVEKDSVPADGYGFYASAFDLHDKH